MKANPKLALFLPLAALALVVIVAHEASASTSASGETCSHISITLATGTRTFAFSDLNGGGTNIQTCNSGQFPLDEVPYGGSIQFSCTETTSGTVPPGVADGGVVVRAFADNAGFPAGTAGAGSFWSRAGNTNNCPTSSNTVLWCTSDGTSTGAPRSGIVRLYVSATRTSVPTFADDSDDGSQGTDVASDGVVLCKAKESSLTLTPPVNGRYAGGNTVTETLNLASAGYGSSTVGRLRVKCGSPWDGHSGMTSTYAATSTSPTSSSTIASSTWPDGCGNIKANVSITAHSQLSGYATLPFTVFDAASADTPSNNTQTWTTTNQGTFNLGPTDIELNEPGAVSYAGTFDGVNMTKCNSGVPTCANVSSFTISADSAFAQPWGLRDATGTIASSVSVSCQQIKPDTTIFQTITMGTTDAHGTAPIQPLTVTSPKGTWSITCTATWNGNTASYHQSFFFASAYTADTSLGVKWNVSYVPANGTFLVNVTGIIRSYDPSADDVSATFPDVSPKCTILAFDATMGRYSRLLLDRFVMTQTAPTSASFWCQFWTTRANLADDFAFVYANITGSPFVGSQGYALPSTTGPLNVVGDLTVSGGATVAGTVSASRFVGKYDISQADGMISTSNDSYVQFFVFAGLAALATVLGVWGVRQRALGAKVMLVAVLVLATIWAATASVDAAQTNVRWVSVISTAGWALILAATAKPTGG